MREIERITTLAEQAASLLPGPPADGEIGGYLAWRELVWSTAMRLGAMAGRSLGRPTLGPELETCTTVTAQHLLDLAGLAQHDWPSTDAPSGARAEGPASRPTVPATHAAGTTSPRPRQAATSCRTGRRRTMVRMR